MQERRGNAAPRERKPRAPLGHLARLEAALRRATNVDDIARSVLSDLVSLPDVRRVGIALAEGGGRRLSFLSNERVAEDDLDWCHIDAYDDVPLTVVVRTGEPIVSNLDDLGVRFEGLVEAQRRKSVRALAVLPLPGAGSPIGGLIVFFERVQDFSAAQFRLLDAAARRTAEAVRRVRGGTGRAAHGVAVPEPADDARHASVVLDADPRSSALARRFLRERLAAWAVDQEVSEAAQLCLSELITNAIVHAHTHCDLRVALDADVLTVSVRDLGTRRRTAQLRSSSDADPMRVHGRGLMLVEALADRWGSEQDESGTTVWFALAVAPVLATSRDA